MCIRDSITTVDFQVVNAISIVAIFIIIAIVEKSITLPIILVAVMCIAGEIISMIGGSQFNVFSLICGLVILSLIHI